MTLARIWMVWLRADAFPDDGFRVQALRIHVHAGDQSVHQVLAVTFIGASMTIVVSLATGPGPSLDYQVVVPFRVPLAPFPLRLRLLPD